MALDYIALTLVRLGKVPKVLNINIIKRLYFKNSKLAKEISYFVNFLGYQRIFMCGRKKKLMETGTLLKNYGLHADLS